MKKIVKIILIIIVLFICSTHISQVYARQVEGTDSSGGAGKSGYTGSNGFNTEKWKPNLKNSAEFSKKANIIVGAIRAIGIIVSVGALIAIGIKTMLGSVEEKSAYKQAMPGYILGAIMVMAITSIPSLIYSIVNK